MANPDPFSAPFTTSIATPITTPITAPAWESGLPAGAASAQDAADQDLSDWPGIPGLRAQTRLGHGGMGATFVVTPALRGADAQQQQLPRWSVVKTPHRHLLAGPDAAILRTRFQMEARALRACQDIAGIPRLLLDRSGQRQPWLAMEYLSGQTLSACVREHGAIQAQAVAAIGASLVRTVSQVAERGFWHRDISASNVFIAVGEDSASGQQAVYLLDFGIARARGRSMTPPGVVLGKAEYLAPERRPSAHRDAASAGAEADEASEVYALGVTLLVAASGMQAGSGPTAMLAAVQHSDLHRVLWTAVRARPGERPCLADLGADLASIAGGLALVTSLRPGRPGAPPLVRAVPSAGVSETSATVPHPAPVKVALPAQGRSAEATKDAVEATSRGGVGRETPASTRVAEGAADPVPVPRQGPSARPGARKPSRGTLEMAGSVAVLVLLGVVCGVGSLIGMDITGEQVSRGAMSANLASSVWLAGWVACPVLASLMHAWARARWVRQRTGLTVRDLRRRRRCQRTRASVSGSLWADKGETFPAWLSVGWGALAVGMSTWGFLAVEVHPDMAPQSGWGFWAVRGGAACAWLWGLVLLCWAPRWWVQSLRRWRREGLLSEREARAAWPTWPIRPTSSPAPSRPSVGREAARRAA